MTSDLATRQRRKLLVLTSTFPRWESDSEPPFVFELCRRLANDFDILVLAPHAPGAQTCETLDGLKVERFRYFFEWGEMLAYEGGILAKLRRQPLNYLLVPFFMAAMLLSTIRILRTEAIDVIHAHWLIPQGLVAVLARIFTRRRPTILCTAHGSDVLALRGALFTAIRRYTLRHADAVTVVSEALCQRVLDTGVAPGIVSVLPMGVDANKRFVPVRSVLRNGNEVLFVGRLVPGKGVDLLLRALPTVLAARPKTVLTLVGQGPMEPALRRLCAELGLAQQVHFAGAIRNELLPDYFRRAALLVLPSHVEGFGLVCAEAMACECPVIATDLPVLREIVLDRQTGVLFPENDIQALSASMLELLADAALRQRLGAAGCKRVMERYDWEVIARGYRDLLLWMVPVSDARRQ